VAERRIRDERDSVADESDGYAMLFITDGAGVQVYQRSLAENGTFMTTAGAPGSWRCASICRSQWRPLVATEASVARWVGRLGEAPPIIRPAFSRRAAGSAPVAET